MGNFFNKKFKNCDYKLEVLSYNEIMGTTNYKVNAERIVKTIFLWWNRFKTIQLKADGRSRPIDVVIHQQLIMLMIRVSINNNKKSELFNKDSNDDNLVLLLWHVESFESYNPVKLWTVAKLDVFCRGNKKPDFETALVLIACVVSRTVEYFE